MKRTITLLAIALTVTACQTKSYHCLSMDSEFKDTTVRSDNKGITRYEFKRDTKVGDTIIIWHTPDTGYNYIVKTIK